MGMTLASGLAHTDVVAAMDAVPSLVALLDTDGRIFAVNAAWRRLAALQGASPDATGPGVSYLDVCDRALGQGDRRGAQFGEGLRKVLGGQRRTWWLDARVNVHGETRLFRGRVTRVESPDGPFVIVAHTDLSTPNVAYGVAA
jgi:PAS domain-containing protein